MATIIDPEQEISSFLKLHFGKFFNTKQILTKTRLKFSHSPAQVSVILENMADNGLVEKGFDYKYRISYNDKIIQGRIFKIVDGFAFLETTDVPIEVSVNIKNAPPLLIGDVIEVLSVSQSRSFLETQFRSVIEYAKREFVGMIEKAGKYYLFRPSSNRLKEEIFVDPKVASKLELTKKYLVKLRYVPFEGYYGDVLEEIGESGLHETEMHSIILEFGFETVFPPEVIAETEKISEVIDPQEIASRKDFRDVTTFTIDPFDAKDFDDAISFKILENGNFEIGVHIADVSHYVRPVTELDKEALKRATSVYLVDRTIPMLPEKLSNGLCSLKPNEDRLAFSAVFEMDINANITKEWYGKTIIHSDRRFTYEEAQEILDNKEGDFAEELITLNKIAYALRDARFKKGSINFESEELKFVLDENGKPLKVVPKIRKDSHKLIEDFMLLANKKVAYFVSKHKSQAPFVYRVHDQPNEAKLMDLVNFLDSLGFDLNIENENLFRKTLNEILLKVEGTIDQDIISNVAVRSMAKAIYSTDNLGHYGLNFDYYSHFTSPIRRYPDLLVHRILQEVLTNGKLLPKSLLDKMCKHSSAQEKKAADAERASIKYKQLEFLEQYVGQEQEGIISGVSGWGFYVEVLDCRAEGLVRVASLLDDHYLHDEKHYCFIGKRTGKTFRLGDRVFVNIIKTDLLHRTADFALTGFYNPEGQRVNFVNKASNEGRKFENDSKKRFGKEKKKTYGKPKEVTNNKKRRK